MKENDCISRKRAIERLKLNLPISQGADNSRDRHRYMQALADIQAIREMPSVTPQEPKIVSIAEIKYDEDKLKELVNKAVLTVTSQEPILDKIRAEIKAMSGDIETIADVLAIIDKYKAVKVNNHDD